MTDASWSPQTKAKQIIHVEEGLAVDSDDVSSNADADGEIDEDDEDAVNDMLMNAEMSSKSPITLLSDVTESPRQSSPLFTPPPSEEDHKSNVFVKWPPSPVQGKRQSSPSSSKIVVDPIVAESSLKPKVNTTVKSRKKRMIFSHIAVPPLPDSVSRDLYCSMDSIPLRVASLMSRPAKLVARAKVHKTLEAALLAAAQYNLKLESLDDSKDATYKPPPSVQKKQKNASSGSSRLLARKSATINKVVAKSGLGSTSASSVVHRKPNYPTATKVDTIITVARTATPSTTISHTCMTPASTVPAPATSPLQSLSHIRPEPNEKRKYRKRSKREESENGFDYPEPRKKSKVVGALKEKGPGDIAVQHAEEKWPAKAIAYLRHDVQRGLLRIYFRGIPPTCQSVLAMNIRHVRGEKSVEEDSYDWDRYTHSPVGTTRTHWFVLPQSGFDTNEENEYYLGGMLDEFVDSEDERIQLSEDRTQRERLSLSHTIVNDESSPVRVEDLSPLLRSSTVVSEEKWHVADEYTDKPPTRPSAKALGKRKAVSPLPSIPGSPPATPRHVIYNQQDGMVESDVLEQYLQDFGPPSSHIMVSNSSGSLADNVPNLSVSNVDHSSARRPVNGYDSDTLSRALISADNDPFISGAGRMTTNDVDPFLTFNHESSTINPWPGTTGFTHDVYDGVFNETVAVNDTIDPVSLRVPELAGSTDLVDMPTMYQHNGLLIFSPSQPISPSTAHNPSIPLRDAFSPSFDHPSPLSPSLLAGRRPVKSRRFSDMVDVTDLDLGSSEESSDEEMDDNDTDDNDTVYVPPKAITNGMDEPGKRKGPRIVSAKELARIQKCKALEQAKQREMEKQLGLRNSTEKETVWVAKAPPVTKAPTSRTVPIGHPASNFPSGPDNTFCHQCRRRCYYLKMECACNKLYCSRCIYMRYDNLPFNASDPVWTCPACLNFCTCDQCTKKRGEVYVPLRPRAKVADGQTLSAVTRSTRISVKKARRSVWSSSEPENEDSDHGGGDAVCTNAQNSAASPTKPSGKAEQGTIIRVVKPFPPTPITGIPGSHWATVYTLTGEPIATASVGDENRNIKVTCSLDTLMRASGVVRRRKRVFIGHLQPTWGKEMMKCSKIRVLEDGDSGTVKRLSRKTKEGLPHVSVMQRRYIGDPEMLLRRVVTPAPQVKADGVKGNASPDLERAKFVRSLSPLSSLSSLSSDTDIKADKIWKCDNAMQPNPADTITGLQLDLQPSEDAASKVAETMVEKCEENQDADNRVGLDAGLGGVGGHDVVNGDCDISDSLGRDGWQDDGRG
ncbi:hypothetical protein APHAL10511_008403 [Amanita phalloides]|nr:hypothetical protein APHAL10511_008403 [Amanita phalloides]